MSEDTIKIMRDFVNSFFFHDMLYMYVAQISRLQDSAFLRIGEVIRILRGFLAVGRSGDSRFLLSDLESPL
jgi:hypothetical protein